MQAYKLTTAVGIWRTEHLYKFIKPFETPWEWEVNGSRRAADYYTEFYAPATNHEENEIFQFPYGGVIRRGLWHTDTKELAKEYNLDIDLSQRGIMDENNPYREEKKIEYSLRSEFPYNIRKKIFWETVYRKIMRKKKEIYNRWRYIRSVWKA